MDGNVNWHLIQNWRVENERDLVARFIDIYTKAIGDNESFRLTKTRFILPSQILLIIGVSLIGAIIIIISIFVPGT